MTKLAEKLKFSPARLLVFGFGAMIVIGTILLSLPIATKTGESLPLIDALFTSTSAICVTGLTVIEVGQTLSLFGQVTLITLIQAGGIGFMIMTSLLYLIIGKRFTLRDRIALKDSMNTSDLQGVVRMARDVVLLTAIIEFTAFLIMATRFVPLFGMGQGLYFSMFNSISAFCNAGFDVFGWGTSFQPFTFDPVLSITTMACITLGGLGFYVLLDLYRKVRRRRKHRLTLHTKLVLSVSLSLTVVGFLIFWILESHNPQTYGTNEISPANAALGSMFQSVTSRTAGFAGVEQGSLMPASRLLTVVLMFVGASPAGTGGGIKTTTAMILTLFVLSIVRGKQDVEVYKRRIASSTVKRAIAIFTLGIVFVLIAVTIIAVIEHENIRLSDVVFEVVSAFGTVGLASVPSYEFSTISRLVLVITMYSGRVGILTFTMALAAKLESTKARMRYPEEKIMIG